ncbi:autotransporter outer membrane beta-barrel domain-containing protein [Bradyrhizobium sp. WSM471]|uniref:autotransporter outer membrane beta-barrel domain-containing protein n=1 Tax=Bradyrhizobium sp. WSM471 TaxID=319017 RepID=UPI00024D2733|nr:MULTISPECIES: autotransporter domain-containing protein [Bradyrhizobium]EHR03405.1 outer membrane autotransporter barrel domain-containing protein [Bradyrhizobium sp. WSM471]UFW38619.1 autotransporter domain-containing protein [Bradyrhizobium canariense]
MHHRPVSRRHQRALSGKLGLGNRRALLASTAFTGAFIAVIAGHPGSALAACAVTVGPNTVTCNSTVTTNTTNTDAATASSVDRSQAFSAGPVSATINPGQTVSGYGLAISANGAGINVVNNGAVTTTQAVHALDISTSTGNIVYSGNGSASNTAGSGIGLNMNTNGAGTITMGTSGTPVTPNFQGSTAMQLIAASSINMTLNGGSLTTLSSFGDGALISGGDVSVALTGNGAIVNASGATAARGLDVFGTGTMTVTSNATIGGASAATSFGTGILAIATAGSGDVTVNQTGGTIFATNFGINASSGATGSGSVIVNTASGSAIALTDPAASGIDASTNGTGAVTVHQAGAITGGALGINAVIFNAANSRDITVTSSGTVDATFTGINAVTAGAGNINIMTSSTINGPFGGGIVANAVDGRITVNVNAGTVRGSAAGFLAPGIAATASGSGGATINIAAGATVTGSQFEGITVSGTNNVINNFGTISGFGGVRATGATTIVNAGTIASFSEGVRFDSAGSTLEMQGPNATLTGQVVGSGSDTIRFSGTGSNTFDASQIDAGWGLIDKTGSSNWALTGTSTTTAFVTVNGGTLSVNGDISSTGGVTVNAGATLGGIGTVSSTIINAGGSLAPGNSIGTLTVSGNLTFAGGGNYVVEVSPATADRTNVTGNATLAGTLRAIGTGGTYTPGTHYTVMNAAGTLSGSFGALAISGNFGVTRPHVEYDANNVYLVLDQALVSPFLINGTRNQVATAGAVDAAFLGGSGAFSALIGLTSPQLNAALDQLSGEVHASTVGTLANDSLAMRGAILGRLRQASYGGDIDSMAALSFGGSQTAFAAYAMESALAYGKSPIVTKAPMAPPRAISDTVFWAQGLGAWGTFNGDGNAASVRRDLAGYISGFDTRVGGTGRLGMAAGYTGSKNTLDGRGASNVDTAHIAGYGGWRFGSINLRGGGAYAFHTIDTDRLVNIVGFADRLTSRTDGSTGQIFGEIGYGVAFGKVALEPFAGAAWVRVHTDATAELGGPAALNVAAQTFETGYATLGGRAATFVPLAHDMTLIPRTTVAWQHAFNNVTPAAVMAFQVAPAPFTIAGVPVARDSLLAEAGFDLAIGRHITVGLSYVGQIGNTVTDHAAKGKFSWAF